MPSTHKPLWKQYRDFIVRGNVIDIAFAVVTGIALEGLLDSFVQNVVVPVINGAVNIADLSFTVGASTVPYGKFLAETLTFIVVSIALFFFLVKPANARAERRAQLEAADSAPPEDPDTRLLTEIRDLLHSIDSRR